MIIRKATLNDLPQIQELNNQLFELELANFDKHLIKGWPLSPEGKQYFQDAINQGYVIVAETKIKKEGASHVVGYLLAEETSIPYYNFKIAELCNMCVDSQYRKQGIGNALYKEFEKHFTAQGIAHFIVTASYKNESAKAFYKKMGFEEANTTLTKF